MPSSYKTEGEEAGAKDKSIYVDKARKEFVKLANQDGEQEHVPLKDSGVVFFKTITENPAWRKIFQI